MNEGTSKQKIIDNITSVDTILVTVSTNPSVDELAAALGLSLFINDLDKRATAVVSGALPPAITFLEPEKTFENSIDSLRDFVIALDKEKADHLRYKVDGDVVKIFITPYKTIITADDLDYSQGDYNVEMVIALGVKDQQHLDNALEAHGRILHDAIVATIGLEPSELGSVDYTDPSASSLSELVAGMVTAMADGDKKMSEQVASALLTGIVAATDRFSNDRTSSQVMSIAAKLMSAGANQQLIAAKLREGSKTPMVADQVSEKIDKAPSDSDKDKKPRKKRSKNRGLNIDHDVSQPDNQTATPAPETAPPTDISASEEMPPAETPAPQTDTKATATPTAEQLLDTALSESSPPATDSSASDLATELAEAASAEAPGSDSEKAAVQSAVEAATDQPISASQSASDSQEQPHFGGILNATTEQAAEDKRRAEQADRNRTILSHNRVSDGMIEQGLGSSPMNGAGATDEAKTFDPMMEPASETPEPELPTVQSETPAPAPNQTLAEIDQQHRQPSPAIETPEPAPAEADSALDAVHAAYEAVPPPTPEPIVTPAMEAVHGAQPPEAVDALLADSQATPAPVDLSGAIPTPPPPPPPEIAGDSVPPLPAAPPPPDFSQLPTPPIVPTVPHVDVPPVPTLPPENLGNTFPTPPAGPPATPPSNDPGQFKIPGQ